MNNTKIYLVIYDNKGREISRVESPKFVIESWRYAWAVRLFAKRRKVDKNSDHWDFVKVAH